MAAKKEEIVMESVVTKGKEGGSPTNTVAIPGDDDSYDPHAHRCPEHPTTNGETLVHLIKGSLGTGILAMPQAFYYSGLLVGTISTFMIGVIATYCLHVLVRSQYIICKRLKVPLLTYPESMRIALESGPQFLRPFSSASAVIVDVFLVFYQIGICCVYVVFVSENVKRVADDYIAEIDVRIWMLILLGPLILINLIRNLKLLAPFSQAANIITFIGTGIVMYYVFRDLPSPSTRAMSGDLRNYALYFGTVLFALEAVGVFIALENNMKTPKDFGGYFGVLNIGMIMIVFLYAFVGFFGYVRYGPDSKGSVTLNLPIGDKLAQSVNLLFAIAVFISYALQCYVPVDILWNSYIKKRYEDSNHKIAMEYALRIAIVLITFLLAIAVPLLSLFISLFGALCLSALGIAFPAIIEICVLWPDKLGRYNYVLVKDILLIIFGIIGLVVGSGTALLDIVTALGTPS